MDGSGVGSECMSGANKDGACLTGSSAGYCGNGTSPTEDLAGCQTGTEEGEGGS